MPQFFDSPDDLADAVIAAVGRKIVLGLPVGLGKAAHVANAIYARAAEDRSIDLTVFTALTLEAPVARGGLETRFLEPLAERLYKDWPRLAYAEALQRESLPPNIKVREFYFRPAAYLGNGLAQRSYTSLNYTQVAGELLHLGVNVIAQLIVPDVSKRNLFSLGSNPEVTLDLLPALDLRRRKGSPVAFIGQVNDAMPYMYGDAELSADRFDFVLDSPRCRYPMFGIPNRAVSCSDYATGLHVASLIPDGGTLQLGIGSLSDAVAHSLLLRQREPEVFRRILDRLPGGTASDSRAALPLETGPFRQGLYVATELLSDAVFALFDSGIACRGAEQDKKVLMHAGFFVGSNALYESLRSLPEQRRRQIAMTGISFVNSLHGNEEEKRRQRRRARFINEAMMVTLMGSTVSDGLEDGRVVSGVGGQFDFVRMAHVLDDAHSILMFTSHRLNDGIAESNLVWNYGHTTVPRHYRDIFANEYGLAATRGQPDETVIASLLNIADAAFQDSLLQQARTNGKIARDYKIPESARRNTSSRLAEVFRSPEFAPYFPQYPLGTDLTPVEQDLAAALTWLKGRTARRWPQIVTLASALLQSPRDDLLPALERLSLDAPRSLRERLLRRLVSYALRNSGH
ncbi:MAG TPA: acetyl-CoA hydrolase/transferase C-terminal domain-containing protein [Woeseiaceae bacterium]|nr:acetyl-CoA hydrolase/transferase C-terminal domain-containing protein [Woeseiaceae bacterium]